MLAQFNYFHLPSAKEFWKCEISYVDEEQGLCDLEVNVRSITDEGRLLTLWCESGQIIYVPKCNYESITIYN